MTGKSLSRREGDGLGMGIGREVDWVRVRVSRESVVSELDDAGEGGLYVDEVAVNSWSDDNETRVG